MANQFDLEQGIMSCWHVTDDLDVLLEELVENQTFTQDQASNFVLGLSTIYEAKFDKLFRTFEEFLKEYYKNKKLVEQYEEDLAHMRAELREYQDREYSGLGEWREYDNVDEEVFMEDENGYFLFPK
jgi:hypothetical protein